MQLPSGQHLNEANIKTPSPVKVEGVFIDITYRQQALERQVLEPVLLQAFVLFVVNLRSGLQSLLMVQLAALEPSQSCLFFYDGGDRDALQKQVMLLK